MNIIRLWRDDFLNHLIQSVVIRHPVVIMGRKPILRKCTGLPSQLQLFRYGKVSRPRKAAAHMQSVSQPGRLAAKKNGRGGVTFHWLLFLWERGQQMKIIYPLLVPFRFVALGFERNIELVSCWIPHDPKLYSLFLLWRQLKACHVFAHLISKCESCPVIRLFGSHGLKSTSSWQWVVR